VVEQRASDTPTLDSLHRGSCCVPGKGHLSIEALVTSIALMASAVIPEIVGA